MVLRVRDVMSRSLISTDRMTSIVDAQTLMSSWRVGSLAVSVNGRIVGLVDESDLARAVLLEHAPHDAPLYAAATRPVTHISPDLTVQEALETCHRRGVRHLLVDEDRKVVGVVSVADLLPPALGHEGMDLCALAARAAQRAPAVDRGRDEPGRVVERHRLPPPSPLSDALGYVVAAWPQSVDRDRGPDVVGADLVRVLPSIIAAAPGSVVSRRTSSPPDVAAALLGSLTGSVAPFRIGALAELLDVLAAPVLDASTSVVSLAAGCGVGPEVSLPQALQLLGGATQFGGLVAARRRGEPPSVEPRGADARTTRLRAILAALRSRARVIDLREPDRADPAWFVATLFDALDVPPGFEALVIGCARADGWLELHLDEAARVGPVPTAAQG